MTDEKTIHYERRVQAERALRAAGDACEAIRLLNVLHDPSKADDNELDKLLAEAQDLSSGVARIDIEKERGQ